MSSVSTCLFPPKRRGAGRVEVPISDEAAIDGEHLRVALRHPLDGIKADGQTENADGGAGERHELPSHRQHAKTAADNDAGWLALSSSDQQRAYKRLVEPDSFHMTAPATPIVVMKVTTPPTMQAPMITRAIVCNMPSSWPPAIQRPTPPITPMTMRIPAISPRREVEKVVSPVE